MVDIEREMMYRDLLVEWGGYLSHLGRRYSIDDPILREEDIYQEAVTVLMEAVDLFDPRSSPDDFRKMFKTLVHRRIVDLIRKSKVASRDMRMTVSSDAVSEYSDGDDEFSLLDVAGDPEYKSLLGFPSPDEDVEFRDLYEKFSSILDDDARLLLQCLVYPSEELISYWQSRGMRSRAGHQIPLRAITEFLGWTNGKTYLVSQRVKNAALEFFG